MRPILSDTDVAGPVVGGVTSSVGPASVSGRVARDAESDPSYLDAAIRRMKLDYSVEFRKSLALFVVRDPHRMVIGAYRTASEATSAYVSATERRT